MVVWTLVLLIIKITSYCQYALWTLQLTLITFLWDSGEKTKALYLQRNACKERNSILSKPRRHAVTDGFCIGMWVLVMLLMRSSHHHTGPLSGGQSQNSPGRKSTATYGLKSTDLIHSWQQEKKITWIKSNSSGPQSKQIISHLYIKCEPTSLSKCQCRHARENTKRPEEYLDCCLWTLFLFWPLSAGESREQLGA